MATLGGFLFIRNGIQYDYNFKETIKSLLEFCDEVAIVDAGSTDGTSTFIREMDIENEKLKAKYLLSVEWEQVHGREKLSYFQNMAADMLTTDYQFLCQADEIVCESSYASIRMAIETGAEGFLTERVNLWGTPNHMLTVPLERQPCSISVVRLTKRGYWCYDDGENIGVPHPSTAFYDKIKIIHYGFVRNKEVMKAKIINMQEHIFNISHDLKLDMCEVFDSKLWFNGDDLAPIDFTHPPIMQKWVLDRM